MVRSQGKGCIKPQVKIFENLPAAVTDVQETKVDRTSSLGVSPGARFSKAPKTFRVRKVIFNSFVSKNGEVHSPETSFMKKSSVHVKNM